MIRKESPSISYQLGYLTNQGGSEFVVRTKMGLNRDFLTYTYENGGHGTHSDVDCIDDSFFVRSGVYSQKEVFSVLN